MAGDGGTHGDVGGLAVTDLADGDDVRVLTQDGTQAAGEGQADLFIDLDLVDALDVILDRVLERDEVHVTGVDLVDHAVHGGGLTASGRADDQNNAVAVLQQVLDGSQALFGEADGLEGDAAAGLIQQTADDLFAVDRGQGRDTEVDVLVLDADIEAAVLRDAALGNVQTGHDLKAGQNRVLQVTRDGQDVLHDAVDAHADEKLGLMRLEVNITGALDNGALDNAVDQTDGRRV